MTANSILHDLDLGDNAIVLLAETGTFVPDSEILRRAWDLDVLSERYALFIDEFGRRRPLSADGRFAALVELVHEWRRFPFVDPEIPHSLLPDAWPGRTAKRVFDTKHEAWSADGERVVRAHRDRRRLTVARPSRCRCTGAGAGQRHRSAYRSTCS